MTAGYNKKSLTPQDVLRLKNLVTEGCKVAQEIEDLNEGLKDCVKAVSDELEIKPTQLSKLIKIVHKRKFGEEVDKHTELSDLIDAIGHKED